MGLGMHNNGVLQPAGPREAEMEEYFLDVEHDYVPTKKATSQDIQNRLLDSYCLKGTIVNER